MAHAPKNERLIDGKLCGENIAMSAGRFKWGDQGKIKKKRYYPVKLFELRKLENSP